MTPEVILLAITSAFAAVTGVAKALNGFNEKMQVKFERLEEQIEITDKNLQKEISRVEDDMVHDYVLKQDFIREMNGVHQKLDRIWEFMIKQATD